MRDDLGLALEAEDADRARTEREPRPTRGLEPDPPRSQHPQDVAVGERERVPIRRAHPRDHRVRAGTHLLGLLAPGAPVTPEAPAGLALSDLRRGQSLVVAVVPFLELVAEDRCVAVPRELAR